MNAAVTPIARADHIKERGSRVLREHRERMQAMRAEAANASVMPRFRAFAGGGVDRLNAGWIPANTAINIDLEAQLPLLRARSRSLWANTAFGRRMGTLVENNVVGPYGFQLQSTLQNGAGDLDDRTNTAIEDAYSRWCRAENCDVAGRLSFPRMCGLIIKQIARDGEVFIRKVRGSAAGPFGFQLQILDPDRVDHFYQAILPNGNVIRMGVEREPTGRIAAYWVLSAHPGDNRDTLTAKRERVPATDAWLLYPMERAEQLRGIPWAHAVMLDSQNAAKFEEAAILAARAGASKFAWMKQSTDAAPPPNDGTDEEPHMDFEPGTMGKLPYGWDIGTFDPRYPSDAFDPFINAIAHKQASGIDVAHHNLTGRMDGVNYSSARIAEMSERDNWRRIQAWMIDCWLSGMVREWLMCALLYKQVTTRTGSPLDISRLQRYQDALVIDPRGWDWVDPKNEVESNNAAVDGVLDSRTAIARRQGRDFDTILAQQRRENKLIREAGLSVTAPAPNAKVDGASGGAAPTDATTQEQQDGQDQ